jgi:heterodisulfide reductase subunit A-like polyferredoxin
MKEMGFANVVAKSSFVNEVDKELCVVCGDCVESCQFDALSLNGTIKINRLSCVGCGVCVLNCPESALGLVPRPDSEVLIPPESETDWRQRRAELRRIELTDLV